MSISKRVNRYKAKSKKQKAESYRITFCFLLFAFIGLTFSCNKKDERASADSSPKFQQYYNQGEQLYLKHCSNCHQKDGSGLGLLYPPLNKSDYMQKDVKAVLCLMRYGIEGDLMVNGKKFNQPMPGIPTLTDLEIAEIATYIYNSWSHNKGIVDVKDASEMLTSCN